MQTFGNTNRQSYFEGGHRGNDQPVGYGGVYTGGNTNYAASSEKNQKALVPVHNNRNYRGYSEYTEPRGYAHNVQAQTHEMGRGYTPSAVISGYDYKGVDAVNAMSYERPVPSSAGVAKSTPKYYVQENPQHQIRNPPAEEITVVKYGTAIPVIVTQYTPHVLPATEYSTQTRPNFIPSADPTTYDDRKTSYHINQDSHVRGTPGGVLPMGPYPNPHDDPFVRNSTTYADSFNQKQRQIANPKASYAIPYDGNSYYIAPPNNNPPQGNRVTVQVPVYETPGTWEVVTDPYGSTYWRH